MQCKTNSVKSIDRHVHKALILVIRQDYCMTDTQSMQLKHCQSIPQALQEELKQKKTEATRIPNKHMQLRSNKNAYE